jgi:streptomycin 6-kinase
VLVHRDFHGGNVLSATREPWLVIDPKPTVAEREFDAAWYLGDRSETLTTVTATRRLDAFASELGLDRERMRLWALARYVLGGLWSYDGGGNGSWGIEVARVYAGIR